METPIEQTRFEAWFATKTSDDLTEGTTQKFAGAAFNVATKTANYTVTDANDVILVDCTSGPVTITLHAVATAKQKAYNFKKIDASTNAMTIDGNAAETIDGAANVSTTTQYTNYTLVPSNTAGAWYIV